MLMEMMPTEAPVQSPAHDVAELLRKAAYRIGQRGAWTQHYLARTKNGVGTYIRAALASEEIASRCMLGALYCEYDINPSPSIHAAYDALVRSTGTGLLSDWNDEPERTQDEVVAALIRASEFVEAM